MWVSLNVAKILLWDALMFSCDSRNVSCNASKVALILLGVAGGDFRASMEAPVLILLVVFVVGVVVVCAVEGSFVVVVIPIDWNATNALYACFVVFRFLGLVV